MKNKRKAIYWCLLIIWMSIIFLMSNQPAEISDGHSRLVVQILMLIGIDINSAAADLANFIVRKIAHFTEYMILAFLIFNVLEFYCKDRKKLILFSIVISFIYASSDEIHQYFIPGRECAFRDVVIDTCGAITSIIVTNRLKKLFLKRRSMYKYNN